MTDRPLDDRRTVHAPEGRDGPTRDIRVPPLPPPPYHAPDDEPTDQLRPPGEQDRQSTVAFDVPPPEPEHARPPVVADSASRPDAAGRKWPWVLLVLLPLVVIAVTGLVLALLLGA